MGNKHNTFVPGHGNGIKKIEFRNRPYAVQQIISSQHDARN